MTAHVLIVGASGGIGSAFADEAEARDAAVTRLSRPAIDSRDEATFAAAAAALPELSHIIVATGLLHRGSHRPERDLRQIDAAWLRESFEANSIVPALAAKHFIPRLRPDGVFAVLTARVGSITDNGLGGWHSYRASKAAANQLVKTIAVELARKRPQTIVVALHPGTVDTSMSAPFQRNVPAEKLFTPHTAARQLWAVIDGLTPQDSGSFRDWKGETIPW